jgi:hypothetical protein
MGSLLKIIQEGSTAIKKGVGLPCSILKTTMETSAPPPTYSQNVEYKKDNTQETARQTFSAGLCTLYYVASVHVLL